NPAAANALRGIETHHRPHRLVVDRLHHRRALQPREFLARAQRYPADRLTIAIADQSRHGAGFDQRLERAASVLGLRHAFGYRRRAGTAIEHAPAATHLGTTGTIEQGLEVPKAQRGERMNL